MVLFPKLIDYINVSNSFIQQTLNGPYFVHHAQMIQKISKILPLPSKDPQFVQYTDV